MILLGPSARLQRGLASARPQQAWPQQEQADGEQGWRALIAANKAKPEVIESIMVALWRPAVITLGKTPRRAKAVAP